MFKYLYLVGFFIVCKTYHVTAQENRNDTCIFSFAEERDLYFLSKITNLYELIKVNNSKDLYIGYISIGKDRSIAIEECSSINKDKTIAFDGSVIDFKYDSFQIDTSILFKKVGNNKTVVYYSFNKSSGDYHADGSILVFKLFEQLIIGYSIDGCSVIESLKNIARNYFIFKDKVVQDKLLLLLNSLEIAINRRIK